MKIIKKVEEAPKEVVEEVFVQQIANKIEEIFEKPSISCNYIEEETVEMVAQTPIVEDVEEDIKELEQQLDEALEEVAKEEILLNEMEAEDMQVSNNQLHKSINEVNESIIIGKREELIITNKVFRAIEKNIDITTKLNEKYNKTTAGIMITIFILGVLIGMQDDKWIPYIGNILDFVRTASNVAK